MSTSSSVLKSGAPQAAVPHLHVAGGNCPFCEQPIPHDRFEEIKERISLRGRAYSDAVAAQLQAQFAREKAEALEEAQQQASAALEAEREQAAGRVVAARNEERQAAEAAAAEKLAAAERASLETQSQLQARIRESEAAKVAAEQAGMVLREQIEQVRRDKDAGIEKVKQEAAAREATIHAEARQQAEAEVQEKITGLERAYQENAAALQARIDQALAAQSAAERSCVLLQAQMDQLLRENDAAINKVRQDAEVQINAARREAAAATETAMQAKIAEAERAKVEAEAKASSAAQQVLALQQSHEAQLAQRLQEQREALEKAQVDAVNAEKAAAFDDKMKLSAKVEDLQRALDKKTAEELGEGAEIDLYESLKAEFEGDRIERINKGQPGADVRHVVIHNGQECGTIIYDSKNHNAWRNEFVRKLADDQLADKAEHAILSTRKFPTGKHHLDVQDGVILASPARVVAVATIIRQHTIQTHTLRLSNEARARKTEELYSFITSDQCADLFARIDTHMENLLDLQAKEIKAHRAVWNKQGELFRSVQKVKGQLCNEIDVIIGTAGHQELGPQQQENIP